MPLDEHKDLDPMEDLDAYIDYGAVGEPSATSCSIGSLGDILYAGNSNITIDSNRTIPLSLLYLAPHATIRFSDNSIVLQKGIYIITIDAAVHTEEFPICTKLYVNNSPYAFSSIYHTCGANSLYSASKTLVLECKRTSSITLNNVSGTSASYKSVTIAIEKISDR